MLAIYTLGVSDCAWGVWPGVIALSKAKACMKGSVAHLYIMQAHASRLAKDSEASDSRFKGFDEFMASAKADAAAAKSQQSLQADDAANLGPEEQPYSPSRAPGLNDDNDLPDLVNLIGSTDKLARKEVPHSFEVLDVAGPASTMLQQQNSGCFPAA